MTPEATYLSTVYTTALATFLVFTKLIQVAQRLREDNDNA